MSPDALRDFLGDHGRYRRATGLPDVSPSDVIVADLERRGFVSEAGIG